jgi:hypothetical protein
LLNFKFCSERAEMQPANPTKPQKDAIFRTSGRYAAFAGDEPALAILYICERAEAVYICERAEAVVFDLENPVVVVKRLPGGGPGSWAGICPASCS